MEEVVEVLVIDFPGEINYSPDTPVAWVKELTPCRESWDAFFLHPPSDSFPSQTVLHMDSALWLG